MSAKKQPMFKHFKKCLAGFVSGVFLLESCMVGEQIIFQQSPQNSSKDQLTPINSTSELGSQISEPSVLKNLLKSQNPPELISKTVAEAEQLQNPLSISGTIQLSDIQPILKQSESNNSTNLTSTQKPQSSVGENTQLKPSQDETLKIYIQGNSLKVNSQGRFSAKDMIKSQKPFMAMVPLPNGQYLLDLASGQNGKEQNKETVDINIGIKSTVLTSVLLTLPLLTRDPQLLAQRKKLIQEFPQFNEMVGLMQNIVSQTQTNQDISLSSHYNILKSDAVSYVLSKEKALGAFKTSSTRFLVRDDDNLTYGYNHVSPLLFGRYENGQNFVYEG